MHSKKKKILLGILLCLIELNFSYSQGREIVTITRFEVPPHVEMHDDVEMLCENNLKPGRLYMTQWFLNNNEIYRFSADEENPKLALPDTGVNVDLNASSVSKLVLDNVNLTASGTYKCLVIAEKPNFERTSINSSMTVMVIPSEKPIISPLPEEALRIGSVVNINCTACPSVPAATINWFVNGRKAPEKILKRYPNVTTDDGLHVATVGIQFRIRKSHFHKSNLNLKCIAKILTYYVKSDEHSHTSDIVKSSSQPSSAIEISPTIQVLTLAASGCLLQKLFMAYT